jgi:two-component system, response regulator PdtaR
LSPVLVIAATSQQADRAAAALRTQGVDALGACDGANLVPDALQAAPQGLLWLVENADAAFVERLAAVQAARAVAVALVCTAIDDAALAAALGAGLHACAIGAAAPDLPALLRVAQARFAHEQGVRHALEVAQRRLDERKLVDRAKGILMRGRAMSEDEAFGVLRSASMHAHQRVGQFSERIIEAARDADAVNRAGQLRMLSQRIVKLAALRIAGIEPQATRERLDASVARAEQQIEALGKSLGDAPSPGRARSRGGGVAGPARRARDPSRRRPTRRVRRLGAGAAR